MTGAIETPEVRDVAEVKQGFTSFIDDDVIFAKITPCMENGKAALAQNLLNSRAYGSTEFFVLRSGGSVEPRFLHHFVRQASYRREARRTMQSGVGQARVPKEFIENTTIPLAPVNEQIRIVAKLDELRARSRKAREALDEVPALLDKLKQSVLAAAFRGDLTAEWRAAHPDAEPASVLLDRIRAERRKRWEHRNPKKRYVEPEPVETGGLPELPEGWCWASVEELSAFVTDGEHATPARTTEGVLLLSARNVHNGILDLSNVDFVSHETHETLCRRLRVQAGDVLLSCSGSVGRSCVVPAGLHFSLVRSVAVIRPSLVSGEYLSLALRSPGLQAQVDAAKTQTAQANIFQGRIKVLAVPVSPKEEGAEMLRILEAVLAAVTPLADCNLAAVQDLNSLDQSILAKAFRGELVPQDPNDEPAEKLLARIKAEPGVARPGRGRPVKGGES